MAEDGIKNATQQNPGIHFHCVGAVCNQRRNHFQVMVEFPLLLNNNVMLLLWADFYLRMSQLLRHSFMRYSFLCLHYNERHV